MATMVLLGRSGEIIRNVGFKAYIPDNFELPEGYTISWENQFLHATDEQRQYRLIHIGQAHIYFEVILTSVSIRIESPNRGDFQKALEFVLTYIGGGVTIIPPTIHSDSFVLGVVNDLRKLRQCLRYGLTRIRQRIGFKIAS